VRRRRATRARSRSVVRRARTSPGHWRDRARRATLWRDPVS
jgi:hypothetical protein